MKKSLYLVVSLAILAAGMTGCKSKKTVDASSIPYNPYVQAFTSGKISRFAPVYLIFSEAVDSSKLDVQQLNRLMRIHPSVEGRFEAEDGRTIVFRPKEEFKRNTAYEITADLGQWFPDLKGKDRTFRFGFSTLPFTVRANVSSLDVNKSDENTYDIVVTFVTPDKESAETLEGLVKFSEKVTAVWQHSDDGRRHEATLQGVAPGDAARKLVVSAASNKLGVSTKDDLVSIDIPARGQFYVYNVEYQTSPERRVIITFSRPLKAGQTLRGLAYIADNDDEVVRGEGNKLFLYPDTKRSGTLEVHVSENIQDKDGNTLSQGGLFRLEVGKNAPSVSFTGNGVIIPQSTKLYVPFQAVYLRGVLVRVYKILEQNIGQFLQYNNLDGSSELVRVGRLVARKTIFFDDDPSNDLTKLNTYAIDLNQLMKPEPGAIYRIQLSFDRQLSIFPCEDTTNFKRLSRQQIEAQDEVAFKSELSQFDSGEFYYSDGYYDDDSDADPCEDGYYYYGRTSVSRNVMASNLGLIAMAGDDGGMTVMVHNILTTRPEGGVNIKIFNFQNQLLGDGRSDDAGKAAVACKPGRPFYVIAEKDGQRAYLRVDDGSALSLSSFDVSGDVVQKGIKGYIYGERGVWRPGDTIHLGFMLGDRLGNLPPDHPVVMELYNPLGQLYASRTRTQGVLGLYTFDLPTDPEAPTGAWDAKVSVGGVSFDKRIRVETIKPNRLKIDFKVDRQLFVRGDNADMGLHVEWLQGATARNLKYELTGTFSSAPTIFTGFKEFTFTDPSRSLRTDEEQIASGRTDDQGNATVRLNFPEMPTAPGMVSANLVARVYEESGDFSIDAFQVKFSPFTRYAGISSPQKDKRQLDTGGKHTFRVASVDQNGKPQSGVPLKVSVYKVSYYWWWSASNGDLADYMSDRDNSNVRNFALQTGADGTASFDLSFTDNEWGTYFIRVADPQSGHTAATMAYFDWSYMDGRRDRDGSQSANELSFKTDKDSYKPGDKITVRIPSSAGSRAVVSIQNGSRVLAIKEFECTDKETVIKFDVTADMQPNVYLFITLLQPHAQTQNDLPIRMYGVVPVMVSSDDSRLQPEIKMADEIRPEGKYDITVSEKSGKEMAYTLAVVDEGLLDLTRFKTPDPWNAFNAREALGVRTWDLYNYVLGAYGGRIEQLFSIGGDDQAAGGAKAIVNRFRPVVLFDGPFLLKKGGKMHHTYYMPNYNGRVRVMVVAGNGTNNAYGSAEKSVLVRKPVMVLGTLPRVVGVNEEMTVPATVFATKEGVGNVNVSIKCSDNMEVVGAASQSLYFKTTDDKMVKFRIRVKGKPGTGRVTITAEANGEKSVYDTEIAIRSVRLPQTRVDELTLKPGEDWNQTVKLPGTEGTNKLTLEMSDVEPLNLAARLGFLIGYPHGCIEQITSKGFPQLYLKSLVNLTPEQSKTVDEAVKEVIRRHRSYQTSEGGFAYWPGGSDPDSWATCYATHFELEAEAQGYLVPDATKKAALNYIRTKARNWKPVTNSYGRSEEMIQAYRLWVLALAKAPELGAMNRLKEQKGLAPVSRQMLAMAYAKAGRKDVAQELLIATTDIAATTTYDWYDLTFGSDLRDKAIKLQTLCMMDKGNEAASAAREISKALSSNDWMSTQTTAYCLKAISDYFARYKPGGNMEFSYSVAGQKDKVSTDRNLWSKQIFEKGPAQAPVEVRNTSKSTLFVRIISEGVPDQGDEQPYANGLALTVAYADASDRIIQPDSLKQGTNFSSVVTVQNQTGNVVRNVALTQIFPSGWEILNTRFLNNSSDEQRAQVATVRSMLGDDAASTAADRMPVGISYQDFRDDCVLSYIDLLPAGRQVTVRINLAAVYPGLFYLPPVSVEAMYDHTIRANTQGRMIKLQ